MLTNTLTVVGHVSVHHTRVCISLYVGCPVFLTTCFWTLRWRKHFVRQDKTNSNVVMFDVAKYTIEKSCKSSANQTFLLLNIYRPQTKFAKVMFSQVSVCPQGGDLPHCMLGYTPRQIPPRQTLPGQTPPGIHRPLGSACWDTVNKRAVRIPLECILLYYFWCYLMSDEENKISTYNDKIVT